MILIVAAMQEEVLEILKIEKNNNVDVLVTGIGKVNAAMHLSSYLTKHKVSKIINIGFAGGNKQYQVNDIVWVDEAIYHDFDLSFFGYEKGQVPGFPAIYLPNKELFDKTFKTVINAKKGVLFTGDYFMTTASTKPSIYDMEGASLFQVAYFFNIPMISIKVVSDVIGGEDHYEEYKTFEKENGALLLFEVYKKIMEVL